MIIYHQSSSGSSSAGHAFFKRDRRARKMQADLEVTVDRVVTPAETTMPIVPRTVETGKRWNGMSL